MTLNRGQSSALESLTEIIELNHNSLTHDNGVAKQDIENSGRNSGQSSSCLNLQDQTNDFGARKDPILQSSDDTSRQGRDLVDRSSSISHSKGLETGLRPSMGSFSNNPDHSLGTPGVSKAQDDGSPGSSSSGPQQAGSNLRSNLSISPRNPSHINFQKHPNPGIRAGLYTNSNMLHHPTTGFYPERPWGNFNPAIDSSFRQNSLETMNAPLHLDGGLHQSIWPMCFNEFSVGSNTPNMSPMMHIPSVLRNVPQFSLTINPSLTADFSSDPRNLSQQPRQPTPAIGTSGSHQCSGLTWAFQPTHPPGPQGPQQTASVYQPWSLSPWDGSGLSAPCPHPTAHGYFSDIMLQPGPSNLGPNPYFVGPLISQSRDQFGMLRVPPTLQTMAPQMDGGHTIISEAMVMHQDYLHFNEFRHRYPGMMTFQDRHRDMRLDVDNMSYEELLALGEQIGSVRTGLREETIMEVLRRRDYKCGNSEPSADLETCCICREEYVGGEEIGMLNCGHEFHTGCIKQWLVLKNQCPICKMNGL